MADDISKAPTDELVAIYKSLVCVVDTCLNCSNVPDVTNYLSGIQYAYGIELLNRQLFSQEDMPGYIRERK